MARNNRQPSPARRAARTRRLQLAGAAIIVVAAVAGYYAYGAVARAPGVEVADQGNRHIATPETPHEPYNSDPPTSGPHLPYLAPWGVHTRPIPAELQVHNLEDGGVLVQYSCECADVVARLRAIVERYDRHVILAPYPTMKSRIALTAWTRIERLEDVDEPRVVRFIERYRRIDHHR